MTLPASFLTRPITHRALHDRKRGRIENSPSAILAAIEAGLYPLAVIGVLVGVELAR